MRAEKGSRPLFLLLAAAVAVRLVLVATGGPPEAFEYDELARNVLGGRGYVYHHLGDAPYRSFYSGVPYVSLTAAMYSVAADGRTAMLVAQALVSAFLGVVVFLVARRLVGERPALAVAGLTLFHPALVYYDTRKLHPLGFDALAIAAAALLLTRTRETRRPAVGLAAGLATGLAILQRGSMGLAAAGAVGWLAWTLGRRGRLVVAVFCAGALAVVGPWVARNYALNGHLMLESTTPQQFWKGNAVHSSGSAYQPSGRDVFEAAPQPLIDAWERSGEAAQYELFRAEGLAEVRRDPLRFARGVALKFAYFWTFAPQSGATYPRAFRWLYLPGYLVMFAFAIVGGAALVREKGDGSFFPPGTSRKKAPVPFFDAVLLLLILAALSVVHAVFFVEMRHRWAIEPLMLVFAVAGVKKGTGAFFRPELPGKKLPSPFSPDRGGGVRT